MADVQSDAPEAPAPVEAQPAAQEPTPAKAAEPAPADGLNDVAEAAAELITETTAEVVAETTQAVAETAKPVAEAAKTVLDTVIEAATPAQPVAAELASASPELESITIVPATGGDKAAAEGGGEWELLLGKVQAWLGQGKLQALWDQARNPLSLILAAAALLVVLRVYSALLSAIDSLPLIPGLLELVGVIWAVRFGVPKLVQRSQREELISNIQQRWESFRGRG
jgi:hypothetical protein